MALQYPSLEAHHWWCLSPTFLSIAQMPIFILSASSLGSEQSGNCRQTHNHSSAEHANCRPHYFTDQPSFKHHTPPYTYHRWTQHNPSCSQSQSTYHPYVCRVMINRCTPHHPPHLPNPQTPWPKKRHKHSSITAHSLPRPRKSGVSSSAYTAARSHSTLPKDISSTPFMCYYRMLSSSTAPPFHSTSRHPEPRSTCSSYRAGAP